MIEIKLNCRRASIAKLDAGSRGALVTFREEGFPNVGALFGYIERIGETAKLRPDSKLVIQRSWPDAKARLNGALQLSKGLAKAAS